MNNKTYKRRLTPAIVAILLMATLLTACGSDKTTDTSGTEDTTNVEVTKEAEPAETTEAEEVAEVEPVVEEPIAEPTPEPVVYEGIDMESTLPGLEWIQTFNGIIEEPKMVIFNDETNKKVIVENGQKVDFISDSDNLAIFCPKDRDTIIHNDNTVEIMSKGFNDVAMGDHVDIIGKIDSSVEDGAEVEIERKIGVDGEDIVLTATLVIKKP